MSQTVNINRKGGRRMDGIIVGLNVHRDHLHTVQLEGLEDRALQVQCCFTSIENTRAIRIGESRTATSSSTQLMSSDRAQFKCCFTSTETIRTIRDGEPRTATLNVTQLLNCDRAFRVQCCFTSTEKRAKAVSNRGPSAYQPNALPLGQTGSRALILNVLQLLHDEGLVWLIA